LLSIALGASILLASYATFTLLWPDRPDRRLLALGASEMPGDGWQVSVGLYDPATGQRLPIQDSTGRALADGMLLLSP
jgi:hypothetical protein